MRAWVSCSSAALFLLLTHLPYFSRPYFWDETGQFIPAALDIFYAGDMVPHSTIPNVHPPGVMLFLAGIWRLAGYSIPATRAAMLAIATLGVCCVYRLAVDFLCPDRRAALMTLVLLCLSPLFFSQSMMALLDMPAMALTALGLWLFLRGRVAGAAIACVVLVLVKETGALLPVVLALSLARQRRWKDCAWFTLPAVALAAWLFLLHWRTGYWFGNAPFARYNLSYPLNPVRLGMAILRRGYYLFIGTGYFVGVAIVFRGLAKRLFPLQNALVGTFALVHITAMCLAGGAVLERYLLPVLPITLAMFANALCSLRPKWRNAAFAAMCTMSAACIFVNPVYPFPLENNLAWTDFVAVQRDAAQYLSSHLEDGAAIASSFPFAGCLRRPELGYTSKRFVIDEVPDFTRASLEQLRGHRIDAFALFSATWDPLGVMRNPRWLSFLEKYYGYQPDVTEGEIAALLGLRRVASFERRGQWIEVFQSMR